MDRDVSYKSPVVQGYIEDYFDSDYFKYVQTGIYFFGGIIGVLVAWGAEYALIYYASEDQYNF